MVGTVATLLIVVLLVISRGFFASWARRMAAQNMNTWSMSAAQQWLTWAARFAPSDGETVLMQAACFRRLGQMDLWWRTLDLSQKKGAPRKRIRQEYELGLVLQGEPRDWSENQLSKSLKTGLSPHEVAAVFVYGCLARQDRAMARRILESWTTAFPEEAHAAYMWGVYWRHLGDHAKALTEFETALARQPHHELALGALAELLEKEDRLDEALEQYVNLATRCPTGDTVKVSVARVLRKLACVDEARAVLESLDSHPDRSMGVCRERGWIELESGNYKQAVHWFAQAPVVDEQEKGEVWPGAATAFALEGQATGANRIFARLAAESDLGVQIHDLGARLAVDPNDNEAAEGLQRLFASPTATSAMAGLIEAEQAEAAKHEIADISAADSYTLHCRACHGPNGAGNGPASRHLFPKPRDFCTGRFRLVSTHNGVPTLDDLETRIEQGMLGTSMRSFDNLSKNQRQLLAREVFRLCREGIRDRYVKMLRNEEEEIDEDDVQEVVETRTLPGENVRVPHFGRTDQHTVARGEDVYFNYGCRSCHGDDGTGARDVYLFDEERHPSPPRDLVNEPFKGGREPESIYVRILVGMPGSPHPANSGLIEEQLVELVHYCCSLSREPKRILTNYQRALDARSRPHLSVLGGKT